MDRADLITLFERAIAADPALITALLEEGFAYVSAMPPGGKNEH